MTPTRMLLSMLAWLLTALIAVAWLRSYFAYDVLTFPRPGKPEEVVNLISARGGLTWIWRQIPGDEERQAGGSLWRVIPASSDFPNAPDAFGFTTWTIFPEHTLLYRLGFSVRTDSRPRYVPSREMTGPSPIAGDYTSVRAVTIPLWCMMLLVGTWPAISCIWFIKRCYYKATGKCPNCGYDVRASGGRCSECGSPFRGIPPQAE